MPSSLILFLAEQPTFKIIRGLLACGRSRHLRDLASQYHLSPAGVSDIIRRLKSAGALREERKGNRRYFRLHLNAQEQRCFVNLLSLYEFELVRERAPRLGKGAAEKLAGMDVAYRFYRRIKRR